MTLDDIRSRVEFIEGTSVAVIDLGERMECLSSCFLNGGSVTTEHIIIIQVRPDYSDDPIEGARHFLKVLGLPDDTVCFMTAAEVYRVFTVERTECYGFDGIAFVTAGLSNHIVAGEELTDWEERSKIARRKHENIAKLYPPGTINTICITSRPLTEAAKVNAFIPMVEAKSAAMHDLGFKETGTTSDAMAILCPMEGERESYAGTGYGFGLALAKAVRAAVRRSLILRYDFPEGISQEQEDELRRRYG